MSVLATVSTDSKVKIATDGKTYFVKFVDQYMAKWLPVQSVTINRMANTLVLGGVYGVNVGNRQRIVNRKGQKVDNLMTVFKLSSFEVNNKVKLYESSVTTVVNKSSVQRCKTNKDLRPTYRTISGLKMAMSLAGEQGAESIKQSLPEHIVKYL